MAKYIYKTPYNPLRLLIDFNDGSSIIARDLSGYNNHCSLDDVTPEMGFEKLGINLGSKPCIVKHHSTIDAGHPEEGSEISGHVYFEEPEQSGNILAKGADQDNFPCKIHRENLTLHMEIKSDDTTISKSFPVNVGRWYKFKITRKETEYGWMFIFYLCGFIINEFGFLVPDQEATQEEDDIGLSFNNDKDFVIGPGFGGYVDELKIVMGDKQSLLRKKPYDLDDESLLLRESLNIYLLPKSLLLYVIDNLDNQVEDEEGNPLMAFKQ